MLPSPDIPDACNSDALADVYLIAYLYARAANGDLDAYLDAAANVYRDTNEDAYMDTDMESYADRDQRGRSALARASKELYAAANKVADAIEEIDAAGVALANPDIPDAYAHLAAAAASLRRDARDCNSAYNASQRFRIE